LREEVGGTANLFFINAKRVMAGESHGCSRSKCVSVYLEWSMRNEKCKGSLGNIVRNDVSRERKRENLVNSGKRGRGSRHRIQRVRRIKFAAFLTRTTRKQGGVI